MSSTLWHHDDRTCILVTDDHDAHYAVRLIDTVSIVREEEVQSTTEACDLAMRWLRSERIAHAVAAA